ncbi:MAG TPA: NAD(P)-binding protein [Opitutaceae bacterium]|nr:NAD(P)-binding protein [Opitutaceae bacterium]
MKGALPIEIVGGGLAGLSLGIALRRAGIDVTVFEAGDYPRHRVCGEFIAGLDEATMASLGLTPYLADARAHTSLTWFANNRAAGSSQLPEPAWGISRYALDQRLAEGFVQAGGTLLVNKRMDLDDSRPGRVVAAGRRRTRSTWIGLKAHIAHLDTRSDLELHLVPGAYVGLSGVEGGHCNVCGLFRRRAEEKQEEGRIPLEHYLRAYGFDQLSERVARAQWIKSSATAVAGFSFASPAQSPSELAIGDAYAMIPPFTGNGMAMAFQSAAVTIKPLISWSKGELPWLEVVRRVRHDLRQRFGARLFFARTLHRFLHVSVFQACFTRANRHRLLPFQTLYRALH